MASDIGDRMEVLRDAEYFAGELLRRLERLEKIDKGLYRSQWQQAASLTKRIRGLARKRIDRARALERVRKLGRVA